LAADIKQYKKGTDANNAHRKCQCLKQYKDESIANMLKEHVLTGK